MKTAYPLLFTPITKTMVWGTESWDITCRPAEMGIVQNGPLAGEKFSAILDGEKFPLLVKIIDAKDALSIQVHPDDSKSDGINTGKSEMWYILEPPTDGRLIIGLTPGTTKADLEAAYKAGTVEDLLNYVTVKKGDMIDIPPGLIHALTPGVKVAEVQQNSDITYRLYDYNRLGLDGQPRELHVAEALEVSDFDAKPAIVEQVKNKYFTVEKLELTQAPVAVQQDHFTILTCVAGTLVITGDFDTIEVTTEASVFLPADLLDYTIYAKDGSATLLKSYV